MESIIIFVIFAFFLGASLASFVGALVYRFRNSMSILLDRSECTNCKHKLGALDMIPVLSYIFLRGKCRYCHTSFSLTYLLLEITGGVFVALNAYAYITGRIDVVTFFFAAFATTVLLAIALYDFKYLEIPDLFTFVLFIFSFIYIFLFKNTLFADYFFGAILAAGFMYGIFLFGTEEKMGFGDVKLAAALGLILKISQFILLLTVGSITGIILAVVYSAVTKKDVNTLKVPFGSIMALVAIILMTLNSFGALKLLEFKIF